MTGRAGCGGGEAGLGVPALNCSTLQVPHNINFREKKPKLSKKKAEGGSTEEGTGPRGRVARFRYFEDIYGYSGVGQLLCGAGLASTGPPHSVRGFLTLSAPRCSSAVPRPTGSW